MSETEHQAEPGPFRQRGFLASAVVLAVLLVLGVVVTVLTIVGGDDVRARTIDVTPSPTSSESSTDPDASRCDLPGLEKSGTLSKPPEDVTWELVGTTALPASEEAGPGVVEDSGLRYCYAHTPEGALLMAANAFGWEHSDPESVVANSVASGPGKDAALAELEAGTAGGDGEDSFIFQIRGFRLLAYTDRAALVDIAVEASAGQFVSAPLELAWEGGDWRVRLTPDGSPFNGKPLPDLTGYVPWAGA
jgi:hypothetical protein